MIENYEIMQKIVKIFRTFSVGYIMQCTLSIVLREKSTSLPPGANPRFLRFWWSQHSSVKKKKCLRNEVTKTPTFEKMLFGIPQTFLPFMNWVKLEVP